ncbi:MAG: hypothetical protein MZV64_73570 [Ignavibacteriales bacterium]|nr:hypothetical protein [Ignavibacteriales bacterium]
MIDRARPRLRSPNASRSAGAVTAMTGAGISAESGVPTFRGTDGLWRNLQRDRPGDARGASRAIPAWSGNGTRWRRRHRSAGRQPNPGHLALARARSPACRVSR